MLFLKRYLLNRPVTTRGLPLTTVTGFTYRIKLTINNPNIIEVSDITLDIVLDTASLITASKVQSSLNDLVITNVVGKPIPFWIEPDTINTANTRIWFKPEYLKPGDNTYYIYYGNSNITTSLQTPEKVFYYFNDFTHRFPNDFSYLNSCATINNSILDVQCAGDSTANFKVEFPERIPIWKVKSKMIALDVFSRWGCAYHDIWLSTPAFNVWYEGSSSTWTHFFGVKDVAGLANLPIVNTWHTIMIEFAGTEGRFWFNDTLRETLAATSITNDTSLSRLDLGSCRSVQYDWIFVAKAITDMPTYTLGVEETL